ncbi:MAG: PHP domain-containing protein [Oscillospiraceae bacterium]|nr:PHP domain-containing protein [Oscillospiraceae bacterium]
MNDATLERVELSLHTTVSDDISVITPREAIETAVKLGHRAVAVTNLNSVQDFPELEDCQRRYGNKLKVIYGAKVHYLKDDTEYGISLLAKNQEGLRGLYRILSSMRKLGNCKVADWQVIEDNRKNLLCGCDCALMTELKASVMSSEDTPQQQAEIAKRYDYIALVPYDYPEEKGINLQLYAIGKASGIPVVAVGNCHYIVPEDRICKKILSNTYGKAEEIRSTHFRTTEEMLDEFSYLGREAAYEVVVTNTNLIADRIEDVHPIMDRSYPRFTLPNANEEVRRLSIEKLHALYGPQPPERIVERLETELRLLKKRQYASLYLLTGHIVRFLHEKEEVTSCRGTLGSSLVAYLLEISDVNPLPAHYHCSGCGYTDFNVDAISGYDLPSKTCLCCGGRMGGDGHNIPYETCMRLDGRMAPDIEINISAEAMPGARQFLAELLGKERVAYAGTVGSIARYPAEKYVEAYVEQTGEVFSNERYAQILSKLNGVKRSEGRHPGGIVLLPEGMEFEDVTPIRKLDKPMYGIDQATHMDYHSIKDALPKISLLGHSDYMRLSVLFRLTGVKPEDIDYSDPEVYRLFLEGNSSVPPGFINDEMKKRLEQIQPENFSDLVRLFGMSHGIHVWDNNAEHLIKEYPFSYLIGDRDDVFLTLQKYGIDRETAYITMYIVRTGRFRKYPKLAQKLLDTGVPEWYVRSMQKIRYLSAKAHAATYMKLAFSLAWFALYYPEQFYKVV